MIAIDHGNLLLAGGHDDGWRIIIVSTSVAELHGRSAAAGYVAALNLYLASPKARMSAVDRPHEEGTGRTVDDLDAPKNSVFHEAKLLFDISIPTVAVQFSAYFIYPQAASSVGRNLGTEQLAGFSLASLTGNLMCLSVIVGALTALDTLMPRAFGTHRYEEVGKLAIRGFLVCACVLMIPIIPLLTSVEQIFDALGQDPVASALASNWLRIYFLGVPFVLLFRVIQRFLASQQIVVPIAYAGLIGCFLLHPLLLRYAIPAFGFLGSAGAIVTTQFVQALLILLYLYIWPVYYPETWKGLDLSTIQEAVEPKPMLQFFKLSMGGVVSLSVSTILLWTIAFPSKAHVC